MTMQFDAWIGPAIANEYDAVLGWSVHVWAVTS